MTLRRKSKDKSQTRRKIFANTYLIKVLSQNTNNSNTNNPIKIGKDLNGHLVKEDTQTIHKTMPRTTGQKNNGPGQLPEPFVTVD